MTVDPSEATPPTKRHQLATRETDVEGAVVDGERESRGGDCFMMVEGIVVGIDLNMPSVSAYRLPRRRCDVNFGILAIRVCHNLGWLHG